MSRDGKTNRRRFVDVIERIGWPRITIAFLLLLLFILAPLVEVRWDASLSNIIKRFGMNAVLVLALVPMVQSGCGLNFGSQVGIIAGMLGATLSMELQLLGFVGFGTALLFTVLFGVIFGLGYGMLLNRVKGSEMTIALYVGFSAVAIMSIFWLLFPYRNPTMVWGYAGEGLRTTITTEGYWRHILDGLWAIEIGRLYIPTGTLLAVALLSFLMWGFFHTKSGTVITAVGSNPDFARASGINVDRMRLISVVISTVLSGVGILLYQQSYGFIQLYLAPLYFPFYAVSAILIGGASIHRATIKHVVIGSFLYLSIVSMTPSVMNSMFQSDISDVVRIITTYGIILYALTMKGKAKGEV